MKSMILAVLALIAAVSMSLCGGAASAADAGAQPPAVPIMGRAAPVNPCEGVQTRAEVFEFAESPKVTREGDRWVITFASKAACDATVTILDKEGRVVRHLASGVLGKNAPWPFQQNALSQRLEWDGLTTDFKKVDPAGCSVRVGLGLKPEFERNILWDPYELLGFRHTGTRLEPGDQLLTARGEDGTLYVIDAAGSKTAEPNGRAYDKTGKYLRTFFPPPAAECEKLAAQQGYKLATTAWGDRVVVGGTYGFTTGSRVDVRGKALIEFMADPLAALRMQPGIVGEAQAGPRPPELPPSKLPRFKQLRGSETSVGMALHGKFVRMTVDRRRDEIYVGYIKGVGLLRFDGKTGRWDDTWFPKGDLVNATECNFGPDDLLYLNVGPLGYGQWILRLDRQGKPVLFTGKDAMDFPRGPNWPDNKYKFGGLAGQRLYGGHSLPPPVSKSDVNVVWTGEWSHSNTHSRGLYVAPNGMIVVGILYQSMQGMGQVPQYLIERGMPQRREGASYLAPWGHETFVVLMDTHGNYHSANAVGSTCNGHNVFMDRDGNIYSGLGGLVAPQSLPYGIKEGGTANSWGGFASLAKFQWTGKIPLTTFDYAAGPAGLGGRPGTLWLHNAIMPGYAQACTCHNNRMDMDYWARMWIGANQLGSLVVLDANGNLIGSFGRYGNVDDADEAHGRLHFAWIRAVAVSDTAVYVVDQPNRRIVRAALKYAAEETVALP